jgi:hypothetical protein
MNDSEECVEDVNAQLDKLCAPRLRKLRFGGQARSACVTRLTHLPAACVYVCRASGYNIGTRLVDEYFAKTGAVRPAAREARVRCVVARACR